MKLTARAVGPARHAPARDEVDAFADAVIHGLSQRRKSLPSRYFYDAEGSRLFEAITRLPEYYLTRTETAILAAHASDIAQGVPAGSVLIEFGSGSSRKTEILLDAMADLAAYVPVDVSADALAAAQQRLASRFPDLDVRPVEADFSHPVAVPRDLSGRPRLGFFPGSTIGNLETHEAQRLLAALRSTLAPGGRLILGVDLVKDEDTLLRAYNDAAGVTAAFNLNLLGRINRTFGPVFDLSAFAHEAIYNVREARIEMHLVSRRPQVVRLMGETFRFAAGETIHTENSHKYTFAGVRELARKAGWRPGRTWTDDARLFSVYELLPAGQTSSIHAE